MTDFIRTGDGFAPSPALIQKIKENPDQYPDAVSDFAALEKKPVEVIRQKYGIYNDGIFGTKQYVEDSLAGVGTGAIKGLTNAVDTVISGSEYVAEKVTGESQDFGRVTPAAESVLPQAPEGTLGDVAEFVGQMAPGIGSAAKVGQLLSKAPKVVKWSAMFMTDAAVDAATFAPTDQNVAEVATELGIDPMFVSAFLKNPEDPEIIQRIKNGTSNAIGGEILGVLLKGIGKGISKLRKAPTEEAAQIADQTDNLAEVKVDVNTQQPVKEAVETVTENTQSSSKAATPDPTPSPMPHTAPVDEMPEHISLKKQRDAAKEKIAADVAARKTNTDFGFANVDFLQPRVENVLTDMRRFVDAVKDTVERNRFIRAWQKDQPVFEAHMNDIMRAVGRNDLDEVLRLAKKGIQSGNKVLDDVYQMSSIRAALAATEDSFEEVLKMIRDNPKLQTQKAYQEVVQTYADQVMNLHRFYRSLGTSASYQMSIRKSHLKKSVKADLIEQFEGDVDEHLFTLRQGDSKGKFKLYRIKETFDTSGGPETFFKLDELLEKEFRDFEGLPQFAARKKEIKTSLMSSAIRFLKEFQSIALLSQLSTVGLNAVSTGINTFAQPMYRAVGGLDRAGAYREMVGMAYGARAALEAAATAFKTKEGVLDKLDLLEMKKAKAFNPSPEANLMWRAFTRAVTFLVDSQLGADEFFKQLRYRGVRYARGYEMAKALGKTDAQAKKFGQEYIETGLDKETGKGLDIQDLHEASKGAFQTLLDQRYQMGRALQRVEDVRQREDLLGLIAHLEIPFFRTPINILSIGMNTMPGTEVVGAGMKLAERMFKSEDAPRWAPKWFDDFVGKNGPRAAAAARAQKGIAYAVMGSSLVMSESGMFGLTGPTQLDWRGQRRQREMYPPNSMIIKGEVYDLTRYLPFTAPMIYIGALSDGLRMMRDESLGVTLHSDKPSNQALEALKAFQLSTLSMVKDGASLQGIMSLMKAIPDMAEGDSTRMESHLARIPSQFIPGHLKMVSKFENPEAREGYDFSSRMAVQLWGANGYQKRDVLGDPVVYDNLRGFIPGKILEDTSHMTPVKKELYEIMMKTGKSLNVQRPDQILQSNFKAADYDKEDIPSLTEMKAKWNGKVINGWDFYRNMIYDAPLRASKEVVVTGISVGRKPNRKTPNPDYLTVPVKKGDTFKEAIERVMATDVYENGSWNTRAAVVSSVFSHFKRIAKAATIETGTFKDPEKRTVPLTALEDFKILERRQERTNTGQRTFQEFLAN